MVIDDVIIRMTVDNKQFKAKLNENVALWKKQVTEIKSISDALGASLMAHRGFARPLDIVNENIKTGKKGFKNFNDIIDITTKKLEKINREQTRFRGEWLSVMFLGMAMNRVFGSQIDRVKDMMGIGQLTAASYNMLLIPALEDTIEKHEDLIDLIDSMPESFQKLTGEAILTFDKIGSLTATTGMVYLGLKGIEQVLKVDLIDALSLFLTSAISKISANPLTIPVSTIFLSNAVSKWIDKYFPGLLPKPSEEIIEAGRAKEMEVATMPGVKGKILRTLQYGSPKVPYGTYRQEWEQLGGGTKFREATVMSTYDYYRLKRQREIEQGIIKPAAPGYIPETNLSLNDPLSTTIRMSFHKNDLNDLMNKYGSGTIYPD